MKALALIPLLAAVSLVVPGCQDTPVGPRETEDGMAVPSLSISGNSQRFHTTFEGAATGFIMDPAQVAARCPEGFQWILQNEGAGDMVSSTYTGPYTFTAEHCSAWLTGPPSLGTGPVVGMIGAGLITVNTSVGSFGMAYDGRFVFQYQGSVTSWLSDVNAHFTIVDGTGDFEGASGHGHSAITDDSGFATGHDEGSLVFTG